MASGTNPLVIAGALIAATAVFVTNPMLTLLGGSALSGIWWGALGSPTRSVVAMLLSIQWLQASVKLWIANVLSISLATPSDQPVTDSFQFSVTAHTGDAVAIALCGVFALSLGAKILLPTIPLKLGDFERFSPNRLFILLYLPLLFVSLTSSVLKGGALGQFAAAAGLLRFAPIALLIGVWFFSKRGGPVLAAIVGIELLIGVMGYFAGWKSVIIVLGISLVALAGHSWRRIFPILLSGVVVLFVFGTVWTMIKGDYRASLNGGSGQQIQVLSTSQTLSALTDAIGDIDLDSIGDGVLAMLDRISYVDYLADVLETVPSQIEYQNGKLWGEALGQFLAPRFLFPNKPELPSDSERTMHYTGRVMASASQGTSISIGYVGESYIDFGTPGAIGVSFLMGLIYSLLVGSLFFFSKQRENAMCFALTIPLLWSAQQFEMSNMKLVGALTWAWIDSMVLITLVWPRIQLYVVEPRFQTVNASRRPNGRPSRYS